MSEEGATEEMIEETFAEEVPSEDEDDQVAYLRLVADRQLAESWWLSKPVDELDLDVSRVYVKVSSSYAN